MTNDIIGKLSNLTPMGYYDAELDLLCIRFFGDSSKNDLVAFLTHDLNWDLREVIDEQTELSDAGQTTTEAHAKLDLYEPGSVFDKFIRAALKDVNDDALGVLNNGYSTTHQSRLS
jgi:hypothetical protein